MLQYMLDTNICIYVIKNRPVGLREQFNRLAELICISTITLTELYYGVEKSSRRIQNFKRSSSSLPGSKPCRSLPRPRFITAKSEPNWNERVSLLAPTTC